MNQESIQQLLQRFPLFKDLTDQEIQPIVHIAKHHTYRLGTHIFMQGDPLTNVYFIHHGAIKIYRTDTQGKEQIVNILKDGQMFPHQGFFRKGNYPAHAQVMEEAELIYIPIRSFEDFLVKHPQVCIKIFRILGDKIVDLQNRLEEQILHNTYEQIILLLIRLAKNHGEQLDDEQYCIKTQFTNRDLANMIGSSRETVSRTLTYLKKKALINTDESGNFILNIEQLKEEIFN
ncbi:Crp/Fnr family transcriptional regulator [Lysinibacillus antri]|uniref:Crp/Fnr family transcriptional regulator n=1 Tax=Lysinibacillus antri TaxID=2498145 RepID=A0A3S0RV64_9BACI|nr:Crp/Fnr family transcriptional regulator [Lysinibacillus antri]RUL51642.1 Crp/Fnr family transcriptional regulator [Lysinibacillus antri]